LIDFESVLPFHGFLQEFPRFAPINCGLRKSTARGMGSFPQGKQRSISNIHFLIARSRANELLRSANPADPNCA
jgi:hypothetical protein